MMIRLNTKSKLAGVVDTLKSTIPNFDPGLPEVKGLERFIHINRDVLPDEISGVITGFEQTDGVVQIRSINSDKELEDDMYLFYAHDGSLLHIYEAQTDPIKGRYFVEVAEDRLLSMLEIEKGISIQAVASVIHSANASFSKRFPRSSLYVAQKVINEQKDGLIGNDGLFFFIRAALEGFENTSIEWSPTPEFFAIHQSLEDKKMVFVDDATKKLVIKPNLDEEGIYASYIAAVYSSLANPRSREVFEASIEKEAQRVSARNEKAGIDIVSMLQALKSGSEMPLHFIKKDKAQKLDADEGKLFDDALACGELQDAFDSLSEKEKVLVKNILIAESQKAYRSTKTNEVAGILELIKRLTSVESENLKTNPVSTGYEQVFVTLNNVEDYSISIQKMYDAAEHKEKESFIKNLEKKAKRSRSKKAGDDIKLISQKISSNQKSERLDESPIMGSHLVVEPDAGFFDIISRLDEEKQKMANKRLENEGELSDFEKSYEDKLTVIEKIAKVTGLDKKIISSKVGGWMTVYDPKMNDTFIYDASVLRKEMGFETFEGYVSQTAPLRKIIKGLEDVLHRKENNFSTSLLTKANFEQCGFTKDEASSIFEQSQTAQLAALYDKAIWFGTALDIDEEILSEYIQKSPQERMIMGDKFLQTIVMSERGARIKSTKQMTIPPLTKKDQRPRTEGGVPRSIAMSLIAHFKDGARLDKIVDEKSFSMATFRKTNDVSNYAKSEEKIRGNTTYTLESIIGRERAFFLPVSKSFSETIAHHIISLKDCDLDGNRLYETKDGEGRQVMESYPTDIDGILTKITETISKKIDSSWSNGKADQLQELLSVFIEAKMTDNRIAFLKEKLFENPSTVVNIFMNEALAVNIQRLFKSGNRSFITNANKAEVNNVVAQIRKAVLENDSSGLRYAEPKERQGADVKKDREALAGAQFWIAGKLDEGIEAIKMLREKGAKHASENQISLARSGGEDANPIWYAPEIRESLDVIHVLANQQAMAIISGNSYNKVHENTNSPYFKVTKNEATGYKELGVKDNFSTAIGRSIQEFKDKELSGPAIALLKAGLTSNAGQSKSISNAMSNIANLMKRQNQQGSEPEETLVEIEVAPVFMGGTSEEKEVPAPKAAPIQQEQILEIEPIMIEAISEEKEVAIDEAAFEKQGMDDEVDSGFDIEDEEAFMALLHDQEKVSDINVQLEDEDDINDFPSLRR